MKRAGITRQFMILVIAFAVTMPAALGGLAYVFYRSHAASERISAEHDRATQALFALVETVGQVQATVQRLIREKDPDNIEKLVDQGKAASQAVLAKIQEAGASQGDIAIAFQEVNNANEKSIALLMRAESGLAQQALIEESNPAFERLLSAIGKTQRMMNERELRENAESDAAGSRVQITIFVLVGIVITVLIGGALWIVRRIGVTLNQVLAELRTASDASAAAATQISGTSQVLAQGAAQQAASLEETSASSEEISSITMKNAANADQAAEQMKVAASQIADANIRLEQLVLSMNEITSSSDKISKIIQVIEGVAFQTNILALNAAVEAARAGESGLGFAVVADEVRNLAQRCSEAARDTAALIENSIGKTKEGKEKLDEVSGTFRRITDSARQVNTLVDEVRAASTEQARGVTQISEALSRMQHVTQQTAASSEEGAAAGEELSSQSRAMKDTVARLAALVGGAA